MLDIIFDKTGKATEKQKAAASDRIIRANLRFVFKKAKQLSQGDVNQFLELISVGNEGLLAGLAKFNPDSGVRFLSYAGWWVMQRQYKEMSNMRIVSLPVWKQQLAARIERFQEDLGRPATMAELMKAFPDNKEKDLKELSHTKYLTYYIDDFLKEDDRGGYLEELIIEESDNDGISSSLDALPSPMKEVIELSFGMDDGEVKKISTVAKELGIKVEVARKLKAEGLAKLKDLLKDSYS
ncbi:MAG TPA: sigma-70 family RNA polymerase sigma factor [Methanosarcina sp.]|nr:sigma-70 family RNA polymerase sigma factor [Methanosarcina sp.]